MQDVRHAMKVIGVMGMEVVHHASQVNYVVQTPHPLIHIALNVMNTGMDVGTVRKGIILMMMMMARV